MTSEDLKHLHPDDVELWLRVEAAVWRLARDLGVKLNSVVPTRKRSCHIRWGLCIFAPVNQVQITLRNYVNGRWAKPTLHYQLVEVIAHECAHLQAGDAAAHGPDFMRAYAAAFSRAVELDILPYSV